jgi:hypothetical protein
MKFSRAIWISLAVPGTVIEIIALIVRKDMSFRRPQIYWIINELKLLKKDDKGYIERLPAIPPGADEEMTFTPPLNLPAIDAAASMKLNIYNITWIDLGRHRSMLLSIKGNEAK